VNELERKVASVALRLLCQILIKIHAGKAWGESESGVILLTNEAHEIASECVPSKEEP
jgi:hypothetical protein